MSWPGFSVFWGWPVPCTKALILSAPGWVKTHREEARRIGGASRWSQGPCGGLVSCVFSGPASSLCLSFSEPFSATWFPWKGLDFLKEQGGIAGDPRFFWAQVTENPRLWHLACP